MIFLYNSHLNYPLRRQQEELPPLVMKLDFSKLTQSKLNIKKITSRIESLLQGNIMLNAIKFTKDKMAKTPESNLIAKHARSASLFRTLSLFLVFPGLAAFASYIYITHKEHERPAFVPYEYLRLKTKRWPWGDGTHSAFHNPHLNPLKDGYED